MIWYDIYARYSVWKSLFAATPKLIVGLKADIKRL